MALANEVGATSVLTQFLGFTIMALSEAVTAAYQTPRRRT
jgi:hypothetical protein